MTTATTSTSAESPMTSVSTRRNNGNHETNNNVDAVPKPSVESSDYYDKGSAEIATESAITIQKLETRRKLTPTSKRLVICLVGLPGRGKSFVARKLQTFLTWKGCECKIFNVGRYRRQAHAELLLAKEKEQQQEQEQQESLGGADERDQIGACDANFFDPQNKIAAELRQAVAATAMKQMLKWLHDDEVVEADSTTDNDSSSGVDSILANHATERVAIFDATNSTRQRRTWVLQQCSSTETPTGVVFVESICDDQELLEANFQFKIANSPDFKGMNQEEALQDLRDRCRKYEEQYEELDDDTQSYIKLYNLSSKILVNHVYGRMAKTIVPAIMAWNIGTRPVFLCRPGKTPHGVTTDGEDYISTVDSQTVNLADMSRHSKKRALRGDKLGPTGLSFRDALCDFIRKESEEWMEKRKQASFATSLLTGTSITGLAPKVLRVPPTTTNVGGSGDDDNDDAESSNPSSSNRDTTNNNKQNSDTAPKLQPSFPCVLLSSIMPRAAQTATWECDPPMPVEQLSSLNPLDKGDLQGLEIDEIQQEYPEWFAKLEEDPFHTRFPGGESYQDLINRLEPVIIELEQTVTPVVCVSHVSVLQSMIAYFRNSPVEECTSIEVPMHTVMKYTPIRGGGWAESHHSLLKSESHQSLCHLHKEESNISEATTTTTTGGEEGGICPIWGDHVPTKFH